MPRAISFALPASHHGRHKALKTVIDGVRRSTHSHGVYGLCQVSALPALHAGVIAELLRTANTGQRVYLPVDDGCGCFLALAHDEATAEGADVQATVVVSPMALKPSLASDGDDSGCRRKRQCVRSV
ncbi:MAG: hypothetical protein CMI16_12440 [Opitutaceae bacterium]|nr:hypothetical protein [Opitutaceae bacterium]